MKHHLTPPVFRLVPDEQTEKRVGDEGMGHKPSTFLIHGNNKENDASRGCIILNKPVREKLRNYEGGWIRATKEYLRRAGPVPLPRPSRPG